jgi:hypothetical protein
VPVVRRPLGVRLGAAVAVWAPAGWDPGLEELLGEELERCESPVGVCRTGVGSGGALTDGVEIVGAVMLGVVMLGVEMLGVVMLGVVMLGVVAVGVVTEGAVTAGTLTVGRVTVGTLTVGTLMVGTLIAGPLTAGTDAGADPAVASSAPQATSTAPARRRTDGRTSHLSPPQPSPTEGPDVANRPRTGPLVIARESAAEITARPDPVHPCVPRLTPGRNVAYRGMARPGLEPGTPRFSVVCSTN